MIAGGRILGERAIRRGFLAGGFGFVGFLFPGGRVGFPFGFVQILDHVVPFLDQLVVQRLAFHAVAANPGFAGRAAPGVVDQADRHIELFVEFAAEEIADG